MKVIREIIPAAVALVALGFGFHWFINIPALKLYHPPAIACDVVAIILVIPSIFIARSRSDEWETFALIAALTAWIGFGWSLVDHVCLAGFCGFLGTALLCSLPWVSLNLIDFCPMTDKEEVMEFMSRAGIFLILAACVLGPLTP